MANIKFYLGGPIMDRGITVYDRLEQQALCGRTVCELNLYNRQAEKLLREGFAVQRGLPVPGWKGEFRCKIGWRYALPHTYAWKLLELAADSSEELRFQLNELYSSKMEPPYSGSWGF